jgi:Helix-turn-helix domain
MALEINTDTIAEAVVSRLRNSAVLIPRLLTLNQAATYLGLTPDALKAKVHMGRIPTVDLDKKLRFDKIDLDRLIEGSHASVEHLRRWRVAQHFERVATHLLGTSIYSEPIGSNFQAKRDGSTCLWAIRLDPISKKPAGEPFPVRHFHASPRQYSNATYPVFSIGPDRIVISLEQVQSDLWMMHLPEEH